MFHVTNERQGGAAIAATAVAATISAIILALPWSTNHPPAPPFVAANGSLPLSLNSPFPLYMYMYGTVALQRPASSGASLRYTLYAEGDAER